MILTNSNILPTISTVNFGHGETAKDKAIQFKSGLWNKYKGQIAFVQAEVTQEGWVVLIHTTPKRAILKSFKEEWTTIPRESLISNSCAKKIKKTVRTYENSQPVAKEISTFVLVSKREDSNVYSY